MQLSLYEIKPRFQAFLRPLVARLATAGVTANQVTTIACVASLAVGAFVFANADARWPFLLVPAWMLLRMALNAIDGMLAREHAQKSALGAYLNELTDVVADAALYAPFAAIAPFGPWSVGLVVLLAALSEMAGETIEGAVGGIASACMLGGLLAWLTPFTVLQATGIALVTSLMGLFGGLVMSAIKRDRGVKDRGTIIEGHGGMLDRLDSVIFAAPVYFHLVRYAWEP